MKERILLKSSIATLYTIRYKKQVDFWGEKTENINMEEKTEEVKTLPSNPQVLFSWSSPIRPYVKRTNKTIRFYLALTLLLSLLVVFFGDMVLLLPLWALLFIFYVFTVTPPTEITHKINQFGVETAGTTLRWEALDHFFFFKRFHYDVLTLVTHPPYPYYAYLVLPDETIKKEVTKILSQHIIYQEEPKKTFTDKAIDWLAKLVPNEEEAKPEASFQEQLHPSP